MNRIVMIIAMLGMAGQLSAAEHEIDNSHSYKAGMALFSDSWSVLGKAYLLSTSIKSIVEASSAHHHGLLLQWLSGWHQVPGTEHEGIALHRYRPNRFYGSIVGVNYEEETLNGVFGGELVLPLNIWSRVWVDTEGEFLIELEPEFALTSTAPRFNRTLFCLYICPETLRFIINEP